MRPSILLTLILVFACSGLAVAQFSPNQGVVVDRFTAGEVAVQQTNRQQLVKRVNGRIKSTTVTQVGAFNQVNADIRSYASDLDVAQYGNRNNVSMNITAAVIDEGVLQVGQNNNFINTSTRATLMHNALVYQRGSNQNLIMQGNNNMSKNMIVKMRGKNQTVLIRNFR